ncbi:hypothetical protein AVEN_162428-1 [Araneus ventricosus]|uniref:Uncharacterized protein n=1 Tax=Araneus ventricosus TaxID=182803 RepID=A0A4Y2VIN2_ARAVE|nr:hypothetical protein AVEN_162428-1 [Araneus ventricosus]
MRKRYSNIEQTQTALKIRSRVQLEGPSERDEGESGVSPLLIHRKLITRCNFYQWLWFNPDSNFSLQQACHKFVMTRVQVCDKFVVTRVQACSLQQVNESSEVTMKRTCNQVCRIKLIAELLAKTRHRQPGMKTQLPGRYQ